MVSGGGGGRRRSFGRFARYVSVGRIHGDRECTLLILEALCAKDERGNGDEMWTIDDKTSVEE